MSKDDKAVNSKNSTTSSNNQVKSIYLALEGKFKNYDYGVRTNYSIYKTATSGLSVEQFSFVSYTSFLFKKDYHLRISVAGDLGKKFGNSSGLSISALKNW